MEKTQKKIRQHIRQFTNSSRSSTTEKAVIHGKKRESDSLEQEHFIVVYYKLFSDNLFMHLHSFLKQQTSTGKTNAGMHGLENLFTITQSHTNHTNFQILDKRLILYIRYDV